MLAGSMAGLEIIGALTVALLGAVAGRLIAETALNVVCAAIGLYRIRRAAKGPRPSVWRAIRHGLRYWYGPRYDGSSGEYFALGGLQVPIDIRDPIRRTRFYGA